MPCEHVNADKVRDRVRARELAAELLEFAVDGASGLSDDARAEYWRTIHEAVGGWIPPPNPAPAAETELALPPEMDFDAALEQCLRIIELCDAVPARGEDFAESIRKKVEGISETINEREDVTEAQQTALDNMEAGVRKWL